MEHTQQISMITRIPHSHAHKKKKKSSGNTSRMVKGTKTNMKVNEGQKDNQENAGYEVIEGGTYFTRGAEPGMITQPQQTRKKKSVTQRHYN